MMNVFKISLFILPLVISFSYAKSPSDQPLDLLHADRLVTTGKDIKNITNLIGNVHLRHGTTELWSGRAVWYKQTDVVVFIDSVTLIDSSRTLTCQTLTYYRNAGSAKAVGEVVIRDDLEDVLLTASKVDFIKDENRFVATGGPVFTLYPSDDSSKTIIVGDSIVYNTELKTGEAVDDVVITRRDMEAVCQKAEFYDSGERIVLIGEPSVIQDKNLIEGDLIELHTLNRSLTGIVVEGNAGAVYRSRPDTSVEQFTDAFLTGKQLEAFFDEDKLVKAVMRRNAVSNYIPAPNDSIAKGNNMASGDSITLYFDNAEVNRVLILGGAQGHYVEEKIQDTGKVLPETTYYNAHEIDYLIDERMIKLFDQAGLRYEAMALKSGRITYDVNEEIMIATGFIEQTDSGEVLVQTPVLREGGDELFGRRMAYNIRTRKGKVELGKTEFEEGYYLGRELRQVDKDVLFVTSGEYTTCDLEEPHFHFQCRQMKMITKDKVIAKPVILYIGPLPVMIIPYYIFPIRKGRHSGFLMFEISNIEKGDRFIRNLGYYWAASDYWDIQSNLDFEENKSIRINGKFNYALRYKLTGSLRGSFTRRTSWNSSYQRNVSEGWGINFSHNQTITETVGLRAGGAFQSSKNYNIDNSYDQEERLNRSVNAQVSLSKRWKSETASIAFDQNWNLDTDVKTRLLPTITFSRKSLPIIPPPSNKKKTKRILPWEDQPEEEAQRWYHSIYFWITSKFQNRHYLSKKLEILDWEKYKTLNSQVVLSSPQKIFGILTISPSATIKQTFYKIDKVHEADSSETALEVVTDDYFRREVWSATISAKTDLYGTVYPNIFYLAGLRHVITPSASYNYAPKTERNQEYYDFTRVGSSSSRKKNMGFSLNNLFQMKYRAGENEKKLDLCNIRSSTSYDFEKDEKRWGALSSSLNSSALRIVNLSMSATHNFYDEVTEKFLGFSPRLVSLSASLTFSRKFYLFRDKQEKDDKLDEELYDDIDRGPVRREGESSIKDDNETTLQVNLSHRYTERYSMGRLASKTRWLNASFDLQLTAGWQIKFGCQYDLEEKRTSYPKFELQRDIHCWSGEFIWRPSGPLAGYYFRIYIKQLPDIKVEQSLGGVKSGIIR